MRRAKLIATALHRYKRSKGFGIHSPFAFKFVTTTLRERCPYYAYAAIDEARSLALRLVPGRIQRRRRVMSQKNARMLFRVVCRFNPGSCYQIGASFGVSTVAVMSADSGSTLTLYAPAPPSEIFTEVTSPVAPRITTVTEFDTSFAGYLSRSRLPFILISDIREEDLQSVTAALTGAARTSECIIAVRNLSRSSSRTDRLWRRLCPSLSYGMSFTNGNIGFITALRHLPVQHFSLWF